MLSKGTYYNRIYEATTFGLLLFLCIIWQHELHDFLCC